ncbi:MAG TPA: PQQ-binding-like beta-propeller repeat protein, partial [Rhodanobacteraceae bacterium]|nr:PQQ-binding-like beta-propeller repeat protein [Rhodanobacteraceae bacterium]
MQADSRSVTASLVHRHALRLVACLLFATPAAYATDWPSFGSDANNTANNPQTTIGVGNIANLHQKWTYTTGGDVSARAALAGGVLYFPDWGGNIAAVNATTGARVWSHQLSDYGLPASTHSRTTPAVAGNVVYVGTQEGAWLLAIRANNGALIWKTQLETQDPFAMITSSPVVSNNVVYTGTASNQEAMAAFLPGFVCCTARGSAVAVNTNNGAIRWKTYMVPPGYSGGSVWGSSPVVVEDQRMVYVSTGNNYSHPVDTAYLNCIAAGGTEAACLSPDDHVDSIVAINMSNGRIQWATREVDWNDPFANNGSDDWNVACFIPPFTNCPSNNGPDYDFGSGVNRITYTDSRGKKQTILGAGQKSGIYYAFDPATGAELWRTHVGPGSSLGGIEWGSATDGKRIYVAIVNYYGIPYTYGYGGSIAALDPATGAIVWQVADPASSLNLGPVSVSNGVVYASSMSGTAGAPTMFALDANNGNQVWSFAPGVSVNAGATIADGYVYWGSGYTH